jgi:ABC-type nitrate/sulfonate/bicarbonate transport system ATPase subunit
MPSRTDHKLAVECQRVSKEFAGRHGVLALANIDLALGEGEFAAVLGPSGCGKSTLLNIIAGFEQASSGSVCFYGKPIIKPGLDRAVVFQEPALFPWLTVWENVIFSPKVNGLKKAEYGSEARGFLDLVGLSRFVGHYPDQLSGGMKQRVGIARALLMKPRMFLMDEPFGSLDAQTRLEMQELLLGVWERYKRLVLFITHDIEEAIFLSDVVYVLTSRPGTVRSRIPIHLERPRSIDMLTRPEFAELRREIMHQIREESRLARQRELEPAEH